MTFDKKQHARLAWAFAAGTGIGAFACALTPGPVWLIRCGGLLGLVGMLAIADLWRVEVDQRIDAEHAHRVCRDMLGAVSTELNAVVTERVRVPRHRDDETEVH